MDEKILKSIFLVDIQGRILNVICDEFNLNQSIVDKNLLTIIDEDSKTKFIKFLININNNNAEIFWDINFKVYGKIEKYSLTGAKVDGDTIVLVTQDSMKLDGIYEDLMKINNEQINYFRNILKKYSEERQHSDKTYMEMLDEISRLNNELANVQRELIKKNRELEELNKKLSEMATKDALTGLYNRRFFNDVFTKEVAKAKRYNIKLSLVSIDLNNFKVVNDTLGHAQGDKMLIDFANLALEHTRQDVDYVFRFGGDEFLMLLVGANKEDAEGVVKRINEKLKNISEIVTLSYGIVGINIEGEVDAEKLIIQADKLMYEYKKKIKGRG